MRQNGIPILGQPQPDYAFGVVLMLPATVEDRAALTDSIATIKARKAKGDVCVMRGTEFRAFSLEDFEKLIFGDDLNDVDNLVQSTIIAP